MNSFQCLLRCKRVPLVMSRRVCGSENKHNPLQNERRLHFFRITHVQLGEDGLHRKRTARATAGAWERPSVCPRSRIRSGADRHGFAVPLGVCRSTRGLIAAPPVRPSRRDDDLNLIAVALSRSVRRRGLRDRYDPVGRPVDTPSGRRSRRPHLAEEVFEAEVI